MSISNGNGNYHTDTERDNGGGATLLIWWYENGAYQDRGVTRGGKRGTVATPM